jgi:hypothetical protein
VEGTSRCRVGLEQLRWLSVLGVGFRALRLLEQLSPSLIPLVVDEGKDKDVEDEQGAAWKPNKYFRKSH